MPAAKIQTVTSPQVLAESATPQRAECIALAAMLAIFVLINLATYNLYPTVWADEVLWSEPAINLATTVKAQSNPPPSADLLIGLSRDRRATHDLKLVALVLRLERVALESPTEHGQSDQSAEVLRLAEWLAH